MSTSKTGKHGHAKVHLVAIDVSLLFVRDCLGWKPWAFWVARMEAMGKANSR
jgi:hypothetical protein